MPNQLKAGSHRVSYVEEVSTSKALGILAAAEGVHDLCAYQGSQPGLSQERRPYG